jgi:hypothetical protein
LCICTQVDGYAVRIQREKLYNLHRTDHFTIVVFAFKIDKTLRNKMTTLQKRYLFLLNDKFIFRFFRLNNHIEGYNQWSIIDQLMCLPVQVNNYDSLIDEIRKRIDCVLKNHLFRSVENELKTIFSILKRKMTTVKFSVL